MTPTHWLALLCLLVQCVLILLVWRWIHASKQVIQIGREVATELRAMRHPDTDTPDSEILGI